MEKNQHFYLITRFLPKDKNQTFLGNMQCFVVAFFWIFENSIHEKKPRDKRSSRHEKSVSLKIYLRKNKKKKYLLIRQKTANDNNTLIFFQSKLIFCDFVSLDTPSPSFGLTTVDIGACRLIGCEAKPFPWTRKDTYTNALSVCMV